MAVRSANESVGATRRREYREKLIGEPTAEERLTLWSAEEIERYLNKLKGEASVEE